jgi:hypothetical protein
LAPDNGATRAPGPTKPAVDLRKRVRPGAVGIDPERDFYASHFGNAQTLSWRNRRLGRIVDPVFDACLAVGGGKRKLRRSMKNVPELSVLIAGVSVPGRENEINTVTTKLARSGHHRIEVSIVPMGDRGKFENINWAIAGRDLAQYDWLIVTDDDITTPSGLLDECLCLATKSNFKIFQPAHRFHSFCTFRVTQRHWNALARQTCFVESGPLVGFHRDTFKSLLPFPILRWAWGTDVYWSAMARAAGWDIGIIDAAAIRHKRRIGRSYGQVIAIEEARAFLGECRIEHRRQDFLRTVRSICDIN